MIDMQSFDKFLKGDDLRSLGKSSEIISNIKTQKDFDKLFEYLYHDDRAVVMKSADVIEKITLTRVDYLNKHKTEIIELINKSKNKEFKWHLAQLLGRLNYSKNELLIAWEILKKMALDIKESKIVRVNSIQSLYDLSKIDNKFTHDFKEIISIIKEENVPSINARIRKLNSKYD